MAGETGGVQGRRKVTATDVARAVGVSRSAVSRAFTPGALIADSTRASVHETAAKLGYVPNALARMLISQRSRIVGVVMGTLTNPFRSAVLDQLGAELHAAGYLPVLFPVTEGGTVERTLLSLLPYQPEAVVVTGYTPMAATVRRVAESGVRVVVLNRGSKASMPADFISCDHAGAGALVADRVTAAGYRRVAVVGSGPSQVARLREKGFRAGLQRAGLAPATVTVATLLDYPSGEAAAPIMAPGRARPDAVFCLSDMTALGFIDAVRAAYGLNPHRDYGIVGFDDIPMAAWPTYLLSTVAQPINGLVQQVVASIGRDAMPRANGTELLLPGCYVARSSLRGEG